MQVASNSDGDGALRGARQEDLVRILDELDDRTERLEDEKQGLEKQREELENSSDQAEEARRQTLEKERQLGVLAGTVAAQGPGITIRIDDTKGTVEADMLLDAIQELRAAGAEAIQVNGVRVVASTYLTDSDGGVSVDGNKINAPYRFKVIGKPQDLEPALNIPEAWCRLSRRNRPPLLLSDRARSSWMPCERRSGLTTLGRPPSEPGVHGAVRRGHEVAGGRRTEWVVRGGNCLVETDVVMMSGSAGRFSEGSSCPRAVCFGQGESPVKLFAKLFGKSAREGSDNATARHRAQPTRKAGARCSGTRWLVRAVTFPEVRARRLLTLRSPAA